MTVIAIDGTFASGKGTLARQLASHYRLKYLDTGKLYRAVAHQVLEANGDLDDAENCAGVAKTLDPAMLSAPILKSGPVGAAASRVAVHPEVRAALLDYQRQFAIGGAVLDGRDIGTVICPDADVKLYVDADPEERARRRHAELVGYGEDVTVSAVLAQLTERDTRDVSRAEAPLKPAEDAHLLDTTELSIERAFDAAVALIDAVLAAQAAD